MVSNCRLHKTCWTVSVFHSYSSWLSLEKTRKNKKCKGFVGSCEDKYKHVAGNSIINFYKNISDSSVTGLEWILTVLKNFLSQRGWHTQHHPYLHWTFPRQPCPGYSGTSQNRKRTKDYWSSPSGRKQLGLPDSVLMASSCRRGEDHRPPGLVSLPCRKEPSYRLSSSWQSGASHAYH